MVVSGPERLRGWEAWHGVAGAPGPARYIPLAVLRAAFTASSIFPTAQRGQHGLKTALQAILGSPGSFSREGVVFRAGLGQVQLARLRLAELEPWTLCGIMARRRSTPSRASQLPQTAIGTLCGD